MARITADDVRKVACVLARLGLAEDTINHLTTSQLERIPRLRGTFSSRWTSTGVPPTTRAVESGERDTQRSGRPQPRCERAH